MARPRKSSGKHVQQARAYITKEQYSELQRFADANNTSVSSIVFAAIEDYLNRKRNNSDVVTEQVMTVDTVTLAKQLVKEMQLSGLMIAANNSTDGDNSTDDDNNDSESVENTDLKDFINDFDFGL